MASLSQGRGQEEQEPQEDPGTSNSNQDATREQWVNEGYARWLALREQWTSGKRPAPARQRTLPMVTQEMVLGERPFPRPVPLEAVIECLVEIWEEEDSWD